MVSPHLANAILFEEPARSNLHAVHAGHVMHSTQCPASAPCLVLHWTLQPWLGSYGICHVCQLHFLKTVSQNWNPKLHWESLRGSALASHSVGGSGNIGGAWICRNRKRMRALWDSTTFFFPLMCVRVRFSTVLAALPNNSRTEAESHQDCMPFIVVGQKEDASVARMNALHYNSIQKKVQIQIDRPSNLEFWFVILDIHKVTRCYQYTNIHTVHVLSSRTQKMWSFRSCLLRNQVPGLLNFSPVFQLAFGSKWF